MSAHPGTISIPTTRAGSRGWRFAIVAVALVASAAAGAFTGRITAPSVDRVVAPAVETVTGTSTGIEAPTDSPAGVHGRQIAR
jgi:hypothetical protein